jgi:hypothetical protein
MALPDLIKRLVTNVKALTSKEFIEQSKKTAASKVLQIQTQKKLEALPKKTVTPKTVDLSSTLKKVTGQPSVPTPIIRPESDTAKLLELSKKAGQEVETKVTRPIATKVVSSLFGTEEERKEFQNTQSLINESELKFPEKLKYTLLNTLKSPSIASAKRGDVIDNVLGKILKSQPRLDGESDLEYSRRLQQGSDVIAENVVNSLGLPKGLEFPIAFGLGVLIPGPGELFKGEGALDALVKSSNKADVASTLSKSTDVPAGKIDEISELISKTTNKTEITDIIRQSIQGTTKTKAETIIKERGFITSTKEKVPELQTKVSGQYIPRSTDALSIKAKNIVRTNTDAAERMARSGSDDNAVATASELIKYYSEQASKATNKAVADTFYQKAADIANDMAVKLTEAGRTVQAASILGRLTPEGQLRFAASEINKYNELIDKSKGGLFGFKKKIPSLTPEQSKSILDRARKIQDMPDGIDKAREFQKLQNEISDLVPTSLYKKIIAVWKAGLLTGLKTSGVNTMSNLFHGVSETIKDIPASAVDRVSSLFTNKRTLAATPRGLEGMREGFNKGIDYIKTGFDERGMGTKLDYNKVNFGKSKFAKGVQAYEETIFKVIGAEDQPFYYGAKSHSLYSQAIAEAKNKGLKGEEYTKFVNDSVANPTDEMLRYATNDAETAVFQNKTLLGKAAKTIQQLPLGELFVPFGRTPASVATQIINYSPIGIVKTIAQNIGKGKFDQRLFSQGLGRGLTGTGIMYIGSQLFKEGMVTLDYPEGEKERKLWESEGRKPNSVNIDGKFRDVNVLGPAGVVMLSGAYYQRALEETGSPIKAMSEALAGMGAALKEQTFLQGVKQVMDALDDPSRFAEGYVAGTVSSIIPTIFGDVAKSLDPFERRTEGILGRLQSKVPGLREELEPKVTILGEKLSRGGNVMETLIDPSRPSKEIETPVIHELRRLFDAGYPVTPTQLGDSKGYESLTQEENTNLWEDTGKIINKALGNLFVRPEYAKYSDEKRSEIVQKLVEQANNISRANIVLEKTQGLKGEELKNALKPLYEDKLLTETVFKLYLQLR